MFSNLSDADSGKKGLYRWLFVPLLACIVLGATSTVAAQVRLPFVVHDPNPQPAPASSTWSSPIGLSSFDNSIWVVNPDSASVTILATQPLQKVVEVTTGQEPWSVALAPAGTLAVVANRADGTLTWLDQATQKPIQTMAIGAEPGAVVFTPNGNTLAVSLMSEGAVLLVDVATFAIVGRIQVDAVPYALAVAADNRSLYVTHLIAAPNGENVEAMDDGRQSAVTVIDLASATVTNHIELIPNLHGSPNRLTSITLRGDRAWLPHIRVAPALPNGLTTTLFAAVLTLDLRRSHEDSDAFLPLNDQEIFGSPVNNPTMAVPSPDGTHLYIVLAGSNLVEVVDISAPHQPKLVKFIAVGNNPQGLVLNSDGTLGYVMNYLDRSVTVLDLIELEAIDAITTTQETLTPEILRGKLLFNTAFDPRMAQGSWVSCASCHFEGWPDGVTWIFPDGPRQTPPLWNAGATLPWHWSAALDEAQDVEDTIRLIQRGLGLGPGTDPPLLGMPNADRSHDLDALAAFITNGIRTPALPPTTLSEEEVAMGPTLFVSAGCHHCHGGPAWTTSSLSGPPGTLDTDGNGMVDDALHDVGTWQAADIRGETGFDVPSLLNVGLTAPYFHDGSALSLEELLTTSHPTPSETLLNEEEIAALIQYLQSIGAASVPVDPE